MLFYGVVISTIDVYLKKVTMNRIEKQNKIQRKQGQTIHRTEVIGKSDKQKYTEKRSDRKIIRIVLFYFQRRNLTLKL